MVVRYAPDPRRRNWGHGKGLEFAGRRALLAARGQGRFSGTDSHMRRWRVAVALLKETEIRDARDIDLETIDAIADVIHERVMEDIWSLNYAVNIISTINVVLSAMSGSNSLRVSPSSVLGRRALVRSERPDGLDMQQLTGAVMEIAEYEPRFAAVPLLARLLGLRIREAFLLDLRRALKEALLKGYVMVEEGTKGGRGHFVERRVPVTDAALDALRRAVALLGESDRCLVPVEASYRSCLEAFYRVAAPILKKHGTECVRELRAAYACQRYRELTGFDAPAVAGVILAPRDLDRSARKVISYELGHSREQVAGSYCGGRRGR